MSTPQPLKSSQLMALYRNLRTVPRFLTQFLNPAQVYMDTDEIEMDFMDERYGMAPFVRSNAPGLATKGSGFQTKKFSPAYMKMRDSITVSDNQPVWYLGERYPYSKLTDQQKFNMARNAVIVRHSRMKEVREEWMVAQLLRTAAYNVTFQGRNGASEDVYPMDFGRDADLDITPAVLWSASNATPVSDLVAAFKKLSSTYQGTVTDVLMGEDVPEHLVLHEDFNDLNMANSRMLSRNFDTSRLRWQEEDSVQEIGSYRNIRYLSYSGRYHKADGTQDYFVKPNEVLIVARKEAMPKSMMLRGRVRDLRTLDQNIDLFQKEWEVEDPSGINLLSQASSLAATPDANFCMRLTVL